VQFISIIETVEYLITYDSWMMRFLVGNPERKR